MNLVNLTKPIWLISGLILLTIIPRNFNLIVLAQDSIAQLPFLEQLTVQETNKLNQGEVVLKGRRGNYQGQVITQGNIETAWAVLTDYNNFAQFLPNIASSKVIADSGDRKIFEQVNVVDLWLFTEEFRVQIEAQETKPQRVNFQQHEGDLKSLQGIWQLEVVSDERILITHRVKVEPGSNTEKPFFYGVYESSLEETLKAIALEITKRSAP